MVLEKTKSRMQNGPEEREKAPAMIYPNKLGKALSILVLIAVFYTILSYVWPYLPT